MDLTRLLQMARHRWWVMVGVAVLTGILGVMVAQARNSRIQPLYEATASVTLKAATTNTRTQTATQGDTHEVDLARAEDANSAIIEGGQGSVMLDVRTGVLNFRARDRTEQGALETAATMRSAWLDVTRAEELTTRADRLAQIVETASDVLDQIQASTPEPEPVVVPPPEVTARYELLSSLATGLTPELNRLQIDRVLAELGNDRVGSVEEIDAEIELITARLEEIYTEMATLAAEWDFEDPRGPRPSGTGDQTSPTETVTPEPGLVEDVWRLEALQTQYDDLATEYEELFALGDTVDLPEVEEPVVQNLTPNRGAPAVFGLMGVLAGALLSFAAVLGWATFRATIYSATDLAPVPVLGELPANLQGVSHRKRAADMQLRLEGIRQVRNAIVALTKKSPMTPAIGLARVSIDASHARELAIDLGRRLAASDLRVLLIDLDLDAARNEQDTAEYHSMADFWSDIRDDPETGVEVLSSILSDRFESIPGTMCVMVAGSVQADSDDLVLTRSFGLFLDVCRQEADVVLALAPDARNPATLSLLQRIDGAIAICGAGSSKRDDVLSLATASGSGGLLGAVLLTGRLRPRRERRPGPQSSAAAPPAPTEPDDDGRPDEPVTTDPGEVALASEVETPVGTRDSFG